VSAPQHPSDTAVSDSPVTDEGGAQPSLPDVDPADETASVDPVDDDADEAYETDEDDENDDADKSGDDPLVRVDGDIDLDVEGDRASVAIVGGRLGDLIGPDGATLEALQELTRLAVAQSTGVRSRLMLDVGEFRAKRRADLTALAGETARRVGSSGQPERLAPMNPFERKVVHDVIASVEGVHSESEGEEPNRRVVVLPDK